MDNFDLKKYLAEGKLHENLEIDDVFRDQVVRWAEGSYYYDFDDLEDGSEPGSKIDNFTLIPDSYEDDDYARDYKIMKDYLVKNKTYDLKQDPKEGIFSYPVKFSLEGDGETIRADIYFSPEYMKAIDKEDLAEGRLLNEQLDLSSREYSAKKLFALIARDLKFSQRVEDDEMLDADEALEIMKKVIEIEASEISPEAALGEYIANGEL